MTIQCGLTVAAPGLRLALIRLISAAGRGCAPDSQVLRPLLNANRTRPARAPRLARPGNQSLMTVEVVISRLTANKRCATTHWWTAQVAQKYSAHAIFVYNNTPL